MVLSGFVDQHHAVELMVYAACTPDTHSRDGDSHLDDGTPSDSVVLHGRGGRGGARRTDTPDTRYFMPAELPELRSVSHIYYSSMNIC